MSVKELIFHIGLHKTGTTSIQHFLYKNRNLLLQNFGLYYPETYGYPGHYLYGFAMNNHYHCWVPENLRMSLDDILVKLKQELEKVKPEKVLFSAEDFIFFVDKLGHIVNFIKPKRVNLLLYIRRQDSMLISIYNEHVKYVESINIPKTFFNVNYTNLNYYELVKRVENIVKQWSHSDIRILPRVYKRDFNKEWDAVEDFCEAIGIGKSELVDHKIETNISLSPTSVEALKRLKEKYVVPWEFSQKVVGFLYKYDKEHPSKIKSLLSLEERKKILEFYKESNEKLFREYFNSHNLFELSEEEEKMWVEQEKISKKDIEYEIETKYRELLNFIKSNIPGQSLTIRHKITANQVFGHSGLTKELIKGKLLSQWVGGHIDRCDEEMIRGWILDLEDRSPYFLVKLNDNVVYIGQPNLERKDIKDIYKVDVNAGFMVLWKDIKLPDSILSLPDNAELEVEVIHERTGYIIPGNYKRLSKRALLEKINLQKDELKITKILTTLKQKFFYCFFNNLDKVKEIKPLTTNVSVFIQQNGKDWNVLCIAPKEQNKIVLEVFYNDGRKEEVHLTV